MGKQSMGGYCYFGSKKEAKEKAEKSLSTFASCISDRVNENNIEDVCLCGSFLKGDFGKRDIDKWIEGVEDTVSIYKNRRKADRAGSVMEEISGRVDNREEFKKEINQTNLIDDELKKLVLACECSDIDGAVGFEEMSDKFKDKQHEVVGKCNIEARKIAPSNHLPSFGVGEWGYDTEECKCKSLGEWNG